MNHRDHLLFTLVAANMAVTTDQSFVKKFVGTNFMITRVVFKRASGAFNTACAGGIYTAAAKGGTALIAAAQSYAALTGAGKLVVIDTVTNAANFNAANNTDMQSATPILSLTTANGAALTVDIGIFGHVID